MSISSIPDLIALLGTVFLVVLLVVMHRNGQRESFPNFFLYLVIVLFKSEILLIVKPFSPVVYFYVYWWAEVITTLLSFSVIYEICNHILASSSLPISKTTFFRINVGLMLLASFVAAFTIHSAPAHPLIRAVFVLSGALRIMQIGVFAGVGTLSLFYGFFWTNQAFGIALGYGLYALEQLTNTLVRAWAGSVGDGAYRYISMFAFECTVLIWLAYALKGSTQIAVERVPENNAALWFGAIERLSK